MRRSYTLSLRLTRSRYVLALSDLRAHSQGAPRGPDIRRFVYLRLDNLSIKYRHIRRDYGYGHGVAFARVSKVTARIQT